MCTVAGTRQVLRGSGRSLKCGGHGEAVVRRKGGRTLEVLLSGVFEAVISSPSADGPGAWSGMREGAVCQLLGPCPSCWHSLLL